MYKFVKRSLDIVLSGMAILVFSPLLIPIMIALKCTGEHDIFYGQTRIGRGNRNFKILEVRDDAPQFAEYGGRASHDGPRSAHLADGELSSED